MKNKVLVCITIQENSRRLIAEGFDLAEPIEAPLHILHIRKGETVFDNPESSNLLEDLFAYGGELGGEVHFLCSNDITATITDFIIDNGITHLVIGETPATTHSHTLNIYDALKEKHSSIQISVIPRDEVQAQEA